MNAGMRCLTMSAPISVHTQRSPTTSATSMRQRRGPGVLEDEHRRDAAEQTDAAARPRDRCAPGRMISSMPSASIAVIESSTARFDRLRALTERRRRDREERADRDERDQHREVAQHARSPARPPAPADSSPSALVTCLRDAGRCAAASSFSGVASARVNSPPIVPSCSITMRSLMPMSSGSSLETSTTRLPCGGQLVDELVDLELGADVDAARRLVEQARRSARSSAPCRARPSADCRRRAPPTTVSSVGALTRSDVEHRLVRAATSASASMRPRRATRRAGWRARG